jgi:two-component system cell cycle sensor histidine kinase/response regulator CckA
MAEPEAKTERDAHLTFLERLAQVDRAIRGTSDLDQMMGDVLQTVLSIFRCDRAWLLYPCDPDAPRWHVPMERTVPEHPGAFAERAVLSMSAEMREMLRVAREVRGPVRYGPGSPYPLPMDTATRYNYRSVLAMAMYPKVGSPWLLGLHQCSYDRVWTDEEVQLFQEVGRRIEDALTVLLAFRQLQESEQRFRTLVEQAADAIFVHDLDGRFVEVNTRACESLGYTRDELLQLTVPDVDPDFTRDDHPRRYWDALPRGEVVAFESRHRRKDGHIFPVEVRLGLIEMRGERLICALVRDITDRRRAEQEKSRLEAQLRQAQKMEAVAQLAGGVAHDFNNILTAILGHVELMATDVKAHFPQAHSLLEGLQQVERSAQRAATLTRHLLTLGRRQVTRPRVVSLNTVVSDLEKLLARLLRENIALQVALDPDLPPVEADPGQLEQVIMNLVVNARDAMPTGGTLTLTTGCTTLDEMSAAAHPDARPGEHVVLTVSDTGCGMDRATLERIFEPFFTTKPMGYGTGLGLSTVYGIVRQSGGHITVYSEPGRGTTFKVYLPSVRRPLTAEHPAPTEGTLPTGTETILVCEDDADVRSLAVRVLTEAGYTVLATGTGTEALQRAAAHAGDIDLLLTDVIIPDMDGRRLAERLLAARPGIRTLFMSGYSANIIAHQGLLDADIELLEKPFTRREVLSRVREVLDRRGAADSQVACPTAAPAPRVPSADGSTAPA